MLTLFNEVDYLTQNVMSIYHIPVNVFKFYEEIMLESVPGINQYLAMRVKFFLNGTARSL